MRIRTRLRALILVTFFPLAAFGLGGAYFLVEHERETFQRGLRDQVSALMTAVDTEFRASITPLELLARSPALDRGDFHAFRGEAERAIESRRGDWVNILVSHPETAKVLVNLRLPPGAPQGEHADVATVLEAARTLRPTVGPLVIGPVLKRALFTVRVPVVREGQVRYVLSAAVDPLTITRLLERQSLPEGWAVAVLDGNYRFVMRKPAPAKGSEFASESLKKALEQAPEGWQRGKLLEGSEIYRAVHRASIGNWSASIAVPRSIVDQSMRGLWLLVAGFAVVGVLGLWIALRLASRIAEPISALAAAAPALGRGEVAALPPPGPVDEVRELALALGEAAIAIRDREERQRAAEQALRAADRAKDEFLAMLGHELRNPLASVSNAAQLLKIAQEQPGMIGNVSDILGRQVQHMTRLVDDLLEVGRVTGGKIRLEREPLDLSRVAAEVVETWRSGGRSLHHEITSELHEAWVSADRARMEQVIGNLLDNALKYTRAGGRIRLAVRPADTQAVLEVSDNGEGMSPELIARVFDLFAQGERTLAREQGGLGIGLTLTKHLVELHGGTISASSDGAGRGATFTITLPRIEPSPGGRDRPVGASGEPRRILIVEDNRDARESLAALLRHSGHEVHVAEGGARGLEMAAAVVPDFVLVDIGLPDLDGYELARRLRSDPALRTLRLVALTGYGMQEDRQRALAAGFDEHLTKPVDGDALAALLQALPRRES